jgi:hypothetical protein
MKKMFILVAASAFLFACNKEKDKSGIFKGPEVQVHGGKARSTVSLDKDGIPLQLSIVLDQDVLNSVPVGHEHGEDHQHGTENTWILPLHPKASETTPFRFIMLNWNPQGHEPAGIYDTSHFDIHFYMTHMSEVLNYTDMDKLDNLPAAPYIPLNHIAGPSVPKMGTHFIDLTSPELSGQVPFTQTFIYGTYDSKVVFYEPMITLDFLKSTNFFERNFPQPAQFKTSGYYPTKMKVVKKNGGSEVILDGFTWRQGS